MNFLIDPIKYIADWLSSLLGGWGLSASLVSFIITTVGVIVVASFGLLLVIFLIWLERKLAARIQDRLGPNQAGPYGLLQTFADVIKLFTKEFILPEGVDTFIFNMAPVLSVAAVLLIWAIIPFASSWLGTNLNVGVLYIVAVGSLGILAILMAGWSSNNKYALLGSFRTVAQLVSYEVPMVMALLVPVLLAHSMGVQTIVESQDAWYSNYFFLAPLAALIFFISSLAEVGRTPFDLLEAESEIVAGFHIEYSGMKFAMFFAGEFLHAFTISALTATLFFGGWQGPRAAEFPILGFLYFMLKTFGIYFIVIWVRSTFPRVRIDHMLNFNWKLLTPLSLVVLMVTAVLDKVLQGLDATQPVRTLSLFVANLVIGWLVVLLLRRRSSNRPARVPVGEPRPVARPPKSSSVASP